ncbi:MAG: tetratricopeptide repeat protein [bacterium]
MKKLIIIRLILLIIFIGCVIVYFVVAYPKQQAIKHFNLAVAAYNQNDFQTAINEYKKTIEYQPNEPELYHNLTLAYYQAGQHDSAIETGLKALQLNSADTEMHYYLGLAYEKKAVDESALSEYKQYIRLAPAGTFADEVNPKIAMLEEKLHPPTTIEEKLQKANQDLDMINNALRRQQNK